MNRDRRVICAGCRKVYVSDEPGVYVSDEPGPQHLCAFCEDDIYEEQMAEWDREARELGFKDSEDRCEHMMREAQREEERGERDRQRGAILREILRELLPPW